MNLKRISITSAVALAVTASVAFKPAKWMQPASYFISGTICYTGQTIQSNCVTFNTGKPRCTIAYTGEPAFLEGGGIGSPYACLYPLYQSN